jgi:hypothetical protein
VALSWAPIYQCMEGELVLPPRRVRKPTPFKKRGPRYRYFELNSELRTPICIRGLVALGCRAPPPIPPGIHQRPPILSFGPHQSVRPVFFGHACLLFFLHKTRDILANPAQETRAALECYCRPAIVILLGSNSISHSLRGGTLIMTSAYYSELRMETLRSESVISLHGHTLYVSSRYTFPVAAMPELLSVD